ncbi:hypothetical protein EGM85_11800 [Macrococcus caseolyticus]|uniref:ADP/ATP translocase n=1 Tax=Starmerella bombicola TaxID=75736 RepID=A0A6M8Y7U5_STABO|nr:hypothetical protein [Macrococcus caseolyticus]QKK35459.1 mitochondrial Adt2 [Starmerella bombicola]RKO10536.1 hypothetical protein D6861_11800 [Macrococcus caseolyticus]
MSAEPQHFQSSFLTDFMMAGVSAAVSKTAAAPIERVKIIIQSQGEMLKQGRLDRPYNGIVDAFSRTIKDEGIISMWRGNSANVLRYFPTQALNFAFKDKFKAMFKISKGDSYPVTLGKNIASGAAAGSASLLFVYSLDFVRTKLAADAKSAKTGGGRQYSGMFDVYKQTIAKDGITGLYRGFIPSVVGIAVYRGLYFGLYDSLKPVVLIGSLRESFIASFLLGWVVTTSAGIASYPLDTVRRRMMVAGNPYKSSLEAFGSIVKNEGVGALFKGAGANILRGVAAAGVLALYDKMQMVLFGKKW